ncbi:MAG: hypothetical protein E6G92_08590 [Alphaproteobacteria bacterium]|nr:MAG: hypothetical protein E6G92_08590 [Alphaproteobacteria bacterium]
MEIYRYVMTSDDGIAPCPDQGMISLATCKPVIRRCARPGDWVLGCHGAPAELGAVAWAGRVHRSVSIGDYEREFRGRADALYRQKPDGMFERLRPEYHHSPDDIRKDQSGSVLIFDPERSWYFGDGPQVLPPQLIHVAPRGRNHRVNGLLLGDPERLAAWLTSVGPPGVHGEPPDRDPGLCGRKRAPSGGC